MPRTKYPDNAVGVTDVLGIINAFNGKWWYIAIRNELLDAEIDLNEVDPIQVADERKKEAANLGSRVHDYVESWLKHKDPPEVSEQEKEMGELLCKWLRIKKVKPVIEPEQSLYSKKLTLGGTPDLICTFNGGKNLHIIDYKTDSIPKGKQAEHERRIKYLWQLSAYTLLYHEKYGVWINKGYILRADKQGGFKAYFFDKDEMKQGRKEFLIIRQLYKRMKNK